LTETWLYTLYVILMVGAAGVYTLMPAPTPRPKGAAALLLVASLVGLVVFGVRAAGWGGLHDFYFYVFGGLALIGAVRVITHPKPVYSALYFVLVVLAVAGLLVISDAEFLAAALVIVYAGAILVTYVFVIMLAQQSGQTVYDARAREPMAAVAVAFLLVACITSLLGERPRAPAAPPGATAVTAANEAPEAATSNTREIGRVVLTQYAVALEVAGALLLVAMVGAVWVARRPIPPDERPEVDQERRPPGQIGKQVPPF
jgi:NADH-quinone oxidoreductase subunit J